MSTIYLVHTQLVLILDLLLKLLISGRHSRLVETRIHLRWLLRDSLEWLEHLLVRSLSRSLDGIRRVHVGGRVGPWLLGDSAGYCGESSHGMLVQAGRIVHARVRTVHLLVVRVHCFIWLGWHSHLVAVHHWVVDLARICAWESQDR